MTRAVSKVLAAIPILVFACVEPYAPPITDLEASSIVVVDGFIDATANVATVKLTFANALSDPKAAEKVTNADVWIEDEQQDRIELSETTTGTYQSNGAVFNKAKKYRLRIDRGTGSDYSSDYIELTATPPIDSVTWAGDDLDVVMSVTTHDPENKSTYFKWDFLETYEYSAPMNSKMKLVNRVPVPRTPDESLLICYQTDASQDIVTTSIEQLADKVVYKYPIHRLYGGDVKLWRLYSILVRQQSLTKDAHLYWSALKENNQELGGLFDPMPTDIRGNIHSSGADETVLGYFYGGEVSEKRIFIEFYDLPDNILHLTRTKHCLSWSIPPEHLATLDDHTLIIGPITTIRGDLIGYAVADERCADCTKYRKGVLKKPDYWPSPY